MEGKKVWQRMTETATKKELTEEGVVKVNRQLNIHS